MEAFGGMPLSDFTPPRTKRIGFFLLLGIAVAVHTASSLAQPRPFDVAPPGSELLPMGAITFTATVPVAWARVEVEPAVSGRVETSGTKIVFAPVEPLRPGAHYRFTLFAEAEDHRAVRRTWRLRVQHLGDALWVYARLDSQRHEVLVYRGDDLVRRMLASGGRPGFETPGGVYRIQNRGYHFFSRKYGEGAYYWVRIFGNYLFHSLPVDAQGRVIEDEAAKLGCPASHGCIRLDFPDARWFYENVPDGSLVIIDTF